MATLSISHVSIKGIAACVPGLVNENSALPVFGENGPDGFIKSTGIERRHIATEDICTSDLCVLMQQNKVIKRIKLVKRLD